MLEAPSPRLPAGLILPETESWKLHATAPCALRPLSPLRAQVDKSANPLAGVSEPCFCGRKKLPFAGYSIVKERKPGGEYRARTGDLLVANQALSQLS